MKTTKILGTTTLAGALLFTGVGATHSNEAHADTQEITLPTPSEWQTQHDKLVQAKAEHLTKVEKVADLVLLLVTTKVMKNIFKKT